MQSYAAHGRLNPDDYAGRIAAICGVSNRGTRPRNRDGSPETHPGCTVGRSGRAWSVGRKWQRYESRPRWASLRRRSPLASRPGEVHVESCVRQLSEWIVPMDRSFAQDLLGLVHWVGLPPEEAVQLIPTVAPLTLRTIGSGFHPSSFRACFATPSSERRKITGRQLAPRLRSAAMLIRRPLWPVPSAAHTSVSTDCRSLRHTS